MKLMLYEIEKEYIHLAEALIDNGGELTDDLSEAIALNQQNLELKGQCYGFIVKQMEAEVDIIDSEIKRLSALKGSRNKSIERIQETLSKAMQLYEIEEIKTPLLKISFRKSETVEIENELLLPSIYMVEKTTRQPDKALIKEAIKQGGEVLGAFIKTNKNIQIK